MQPSQSPSTATPASGAPHPERSRGLATGIGAYAIWGFFPLLFPLLKPAEPLEILAHRVIWSLVAVGVALVLLRFRANFVVVVVVAAAVAAVLRATTALG